MIDITKKWKIWLGIMTERVWESIPRLVKMLLFPVIILPFMLVYLFIRRKELNRKQ